MQIAMRNILIEFDVKDEFKELLKSCAGQTRIYRQDLAHPAPWDVVGLGECLEVGVMEKSQEEC